MTALRPAATAGCIDRLAERVDSDPTPRLLTGLLDEWVRFALTRPTGGHPARSATTTPATT